MPAWKGIVGKGFTAAEFAQYADTVAFDKWRPQFVVLHNTAVPAFSECTPLSPAVQQNAVSALAKLHTLLGLDPSRLRLHKEDPKTTHDCPGSKIVKADFQELILEQIGTSEHALETSI